MAAGWNCLGRSLPRLEGQQTPLELDIWPGATGNGDDPEGHSLNGDFLEVLWYINHHLDECDKVIENPGKIFKRWFSNVVFGNHDNWMNVIKSVKVIENPRQITFRFYIYLYILSFLGLQMYHIGKVRGYALVGSNTIKNSEVGLGNLGPSMGPF